MMFDDDRPYSIKALANKISIIVRTPSPQVVNEGTKICQYIFIEDQKIKEIAHKIAQEHKNITSTNVQGKIIFLNFLLYLDNQVLQNGFEGLNDKIDKFLNDKNKQLIPPYMMKRKRLLKSKELSLRPNTKAKNLPRK